LSELDKIGFFKKQDFELKSKFNYEDCDVCLRNMHKQHLPTHKALIHFKNQYLKEIKEKQQHSFIPPGRCPHPECSFAVIFKTTNAFLATREILLIKHYQTHGSLTTTKDRSCVRFNAGETQKSQSETSKSQVSNVKSTENSWEGNQEIKVGSYKEICQDKGIQKESQTKKLFCKSCKTVYATKSDANILQMVKMKPKCKQCKYRPILEVTCRVCDVKIKSPIQYTTMQEKNEQIEKHLNSDEHTQKDQVFDLYSLYAQMKGFDLENDKQMKNLRFFLTVLKAKALHSKIAVMNCIAVLMSILDLSMSQYNDLYKHVDKLVTATIPSFMCFSCNFLVDSDIEELRSHTKTDQHLLSLDNLTNVGNKGSNLACSKCDVFFNMANIDNHKEHMLPASALAETNLQTRKSKNSENKEDNDLIYDDEDDVVSKLKKHNKRKRILSEDDDPMYKYDKNEDFEEEDNEDVEKDKYEDIDEGRYLESGLETGEELAIKEMPETKTTNCSYYYFCLDCEERNSGHDPVCSPRVPISIDIAAHMKSTNHTKFIPINDNTRVQMKNISYSKEFNKVIIKKWKRLVKDGVITEVSYKKGRKCQKCEIVVEDAIDMFKHIKDVHMIKRGNEST